MATLAQPAPTRRPFLRPQTRHTINGLLFAAPWLIGLAVFWLYPILASAYYSFTKFNGVQNPDWVGPANYVDLFTNDPDFWMAVYNTFYFAAVSIPLAIIFSFLLAMMLNAKIKFQVVYRTIYFLPTLVPEVALALVWVYLFTPGTGIINVPFDWIGVRGPCAAEDSEASDQPGRACGPHRKIPHVSTQVGSLSRIGGDRSACRARAGKKL